MVAKPYVPDRGDVVWIDLQPTLGHEQSNTRPALVLSPKSYNQKTGLCVMCPVTSHIKQYPFEVPLTGKKISGVILADQVRNLDWKQRNCRFAEKVATATLHNVSNTLTLLIS